LSELESRLGYIFKDRNLLTRALTHSSANSAASNERLEFLGDRVLGLIIAEKLAAQFPDDPEGALTIKLHALVRREACAKVGEAIDLAPHLFATGVKPNVQIIADACEAVIAALYLDGGLEVVRGFIDQHWSSLTATLDGDMRDAKTALQEWSQARDNPSSPAYRIVRRVGPDHAPRFDVEVNVKGLEPVTGEGGSRREAEQNAAKTMLKRLGL
jgi:ribonuclease-3